MSSIASGLFDGLTEQGLPSLFSLFLTPRFVGHAELTVGGIDTSKFHGGRHTRPSGIAHSPMNRASLFRAALQSREWILDTGVPLDRGQWKDLYGSANISRIHFRQWYK